MSKLKDFKFIDYKWYLISDGKNVRAYHYKDKQLKAMKHGTITQGGGSINLDETPISQLPKNLTVSDQLYIKGSEGYLLVMQAGPNAVLTVSTSKDVRLGLILLDCRRTCEKIAQLI